MDDRRFYPHKILVKLEKDGVLPVKAHQTDAGFDLFATCNFFLDPGKILKHPLNIKISLPKDTYAQITSKSGLGAKGLLVYAGIIDESYRGTPHVVCTNLGDSTIAINKGQKLAQMIVHPYTPKYWIEQVDILDENTDRGTGGFGSTGV